jgi:hypothetical protein
MPAGETLNRQFLITPGGFPQTIHGTTLHNIYYRQLSSEGKKKGPISETGPPSVQQDNTCLLQLPMAWALSSPSRTLASPARGFVSSLAMDSQIFFAASAFPAAV